MRIHRIVVDALIARRYSVPIDGKFLVITANPAKHPMHEQFPVPQFPRKFPRSIMSVLTDLIGGHFTA